MLKALMQINILFWFILRLRKYAVKLAEFKGIKTLIPARFGLEEGFRIVNHKIIESLKKNPEYDVNNTPTR